MAKTTQFLDLDAFHETLPEVVIKLKGVSHVLTPISLADWISNNKMMQDLRAAEADLESEADVIVSMICRSFKTLEPETLKNMPLVALNKILAFAREHNGENKADAEVKAAQNPQLGLTGAPEPTATS